jgi:hypothetical protein
MHALHTLLLLAGALLLLIVHRCYYSAHFAVNPKLLLYLYLLRQQQAVRIVALVNCAKCGEEEVTVHNVRGFGWVPPLLRELLLKESFIGAIHRGTAVREP